jgi:hypothetical protein
LRDNGLDGSLAFARFIEQTLAEVAIAERRIAKIDRLAYGGATIKEQPLRSAWLDNAYNFFSSSFWSLPFFYTRISAHNCYFIFSNKLHINYIKKLNAEDYSRSLGWSKEALEEALVS